MKYLIENFETRRPQSLRVCSLLDKPENRDPHVKDLSGRERFIFGTVVVLALVMGIWPKPILDRTEASVKAFVVSYRDRLIDADKNPDGPARFFPAPPAAAKPAEKTALNLDPTGVAR
jgi:hypothetical protein